MKRFIYRQLIVALLGVALFSCTREPGDATTSTQGVPAVIDVTIADAEMPKTRRTVDNTTDKWTTRSFSAGDQIGIFSTGGLVGENGESQWILNAFMNYDQATGSSNYRFRNDELLINTGMMGGSVGKYVYFPYSEEMPLPVPNKVTDTDSSKNDYYRGPKDDEHPGFLLRELGYDYQGRPIYRCKDYMYISNISLTNGALGGGFYHGFSEMIIMRGDGFDQLKDDKLVDEITVVLNNGYTRMRVNAFRANTTGVYSWRPENYYWPADQNKFTTEDGQPLTQELAKRWKAWKGEDYIDSDNGEPVPREAWYVILPTAHSYSYPSVTYIEIYNNEGKLCQVSNFDLYVNPDTGIADKQMRPGKRYAVEVMMVEAGATIRPHEILDWNEGVNGENDITDERTVGIGNADDYRRWAMEYNKFITDVKASTIERPKDEQEALDSPLSLYGNYNLNERRWQFYITGDIKLADGMNAGIYELQDVLEGASQISNYSISNLKSTLVDVISEGGELRNLDFDNLYVKPTASAYYQGVAAGALTSHLNGGKIENCNVNDGTMIGADGKKIGMLCGMVSRGTVMNCTVSGAMIGSTFGDGTTYPRGLFGGVADGASPTCYNNDASGVILTE